MNSSHLSAPSSAFRNPGDHAPRSLRQPFGPGLPEHQSRRPAEVPGDEPAASDLRAGRYHLYVSYACPWAHRTLIARVLAGLTSAVNLTVVEPVMRDDGWRIAPGDDPNLGARRLRDVYEATWPGYDGKASVPVLWDKGTGTVASTESADIMRALCLAADLSARPAANLYPPDRIVEVERWNEWIRHRVNAAVYRTGFAADRRTHEAERADLFQALDMLEAALADRPYLLGDWPTAPDWRLFCTLVRLDAAYAPYLGCDLKALADYPRLDRLTRELRAVPGIADTIRFDHVRRHFAARARQLGLDWSPRRKWTA